MECRMCGHEITEADESTVLCSSCERQVPFSLLKAASDTFSYALGLRDGRIIEFSQAEFQGLFVRLKAGVKDDDPFEKGLYGYPMPRGIEVRLSEIIWCCDAPHGS